MNDKFSGEFAFFVDNKENRTIEYIEMMTSIRSERSSI